MFNLILAFIIEGQNFFNQRRQRLVARQGCYPDILYWTRKTVQKRQLCDWAKIPVCERRRKQIETVEQFHATPVSSEGLNVQNCKTLYRKYARRINSEWILHRNSHNQAKRSFTNPNNALGVTVKIKPVNFWRLRFRGRKIQPMWMNQPRGNSYQSICTKCILEWSQSHVAKFLARNPICNICWKRGQEKAKVQKKFNPG